VSEPYYRQRARSVCVSLSAFSLYLRLRITRSCYAGSFNSSIARQHDMHAQRDIVLANPSVCMSVTLWGLYQSECIYRHCPSTFW